MQIHTVNKKNDSPNIIPTMYSMDITLNNILRKCTQPCYGIYEISKKMSSLKRILIVFIVCAFEIQSVPAQSLSKTPADSASFVRLAESFKKNTDKVHNEKNVAAFFESTLKLKDKRYHARAAAMISEYYFEQYNKTAGETWFKKAEDIYNQNNNHVEAGVSSMNIGNFLTRKYDFETGIPYLLKSVDYFTQADDFNALGKVYNVLSLAYHDFGNYTKGIEYAEEALKVLEKHRRVVNTNLFWYGYNNLGINYDDSKQPLKAIDAHLNALLYAINASDSSYSFNNLGNTYKKLGKMTEAEKYFSLSLEKSTDYEDQYHLATIYSNMVDIERLRKNYTKSNLFVDSALYYARKSGSPEKLLDIYYYTYQLKKETGNDAEATRYLHDHLQLKDSFFTVEKNKAVMQYQARYESEKKERALADAQLSLTKSKLASKQKNNIVLVLVFTIITIFIFLLYFKAKSRMKEKQLLMENKWLQEKSVAEMQKQRIEISRNLHDSMGAQLTLIGTTIDRLLSGAGHADETVKKLTSLSHLCENAVTELKNTLWILNAKNIHLSELRMKMLNFINQAAEAQETIQFNFNFEITEDKPVSSKKAIHCLRLLQELTNNALKHSKATVVQISILQIRNSLMIHFSDNGSGFNVKEAKHTSLGLTNIQLRVTEMNGVMNVKSTTEGTRYTIETPF